MAKPRVFISSTYYDLKFIRAGIDAFVRSVGYEPILFEKGDIPFHHDMTLEQSCLGEVDNADMLVLIIGGRYGALSRDDEEKIKADPERYYSRIRSVTNAEYDKAVARDIATFIFIDQAVFSEYSTFKQNKDNNEIKYAHVDDRRIFEMLDDILVQKRGNFVKSFTNIEDITLWLRDQWAGIFVELLKKKNTDYQIKGLQDQITEMNDLVASLRNYSERTLRKVESEFEADAFIKSELERTKKNRISRFRKEPLVHYLFSNSRQIWTDVDIWNLFVNSQTFTDFGKALGTEEAYMNEINLDETASREFQRMRVKYLGDAHADESYRQDN